jgi:hypothetical protein
MYACMCRNHVCIFVCIFTHACMNANLCNYVRTLCIYVLISVHIYIYIYIYIHTHTHIYTHTHTHTVCMCMVVLCMFTLLCMIESSHGL